MVLYEKDMNHRLIFDVTASRKRGSRYFLLLRQRMIAAALLAEIDAVKTLLLP
jgi:hypothetical protein